MTRYTGEINTGVNINMMIQLLDPPLIKTTTNMYNPGELNIKLLCQSDLWLFDSVCTPDPREILWKSCVLGHLGANGLLTAQQGM